MTKRLIFLLFLASSLSVVFSCGVKGPPLPPIPTSPQRSEINPHPESSTLPMPLPSEAPSFNKPEKGTE